MCAAFDEKTDIVEYGRTKMIGNENGKRNGKKRKGKEKGTGKGQRKGNGNGKEKVN